MKFPETIEEFITERISFCKTVLEDKILASQVRERFSIALSNYEYLKTLSDKPDKSNDEIEIFKKYCGLALDTCIKGLLDIPEIFIQVTYMKHKLFDVLTNLYKHVTGKKDYWPIHDNYDNKMF